MKSSAAFLGLDIGGTGAKAGVFSADGVMRGFARRGYEPAVPAPGQAEIEIAVIYDACRAAVSEAAAAAGGTIAAMAVSSQGQTFVSLDADDKPLHPAIMWYDTRASEEAERLSHASGTRFTAIATAAKIAWLRGHDPERMARAVRYLLLPDYIAYRLTGRALTDLNTAGSTGLCRPGVAGYDPAALAAVKVTTGQLAEIGPCTALIGQVRNAAGREWGLNPETVLTVGTNDQYAGAIGAGNTEPGIITETSGTALAMVTLTPALPDPMPAGLFGGEFPVPGLRFLLVFVRTAGVLLDRFLKRCGPKVTFAELEREAAAAVPGAGAAIVLPDFNGGTEAVHDTDLERSVERLLAETSSRGQAYRVLLESLAFSSQRHFNLLAAHGYGGASIRAIGGGARSDLALQIKADVLGRPVERPAVTEAAVCGAAMIAAVGIGHFTSLPEAARAWYRTGRIFTPDSAAHALYNHL